MSWKVAVKYPAEHQAIIARDILAEAEIEAVILNKKDSNYLFGYFEVMVSQQQLLNAKHILEIDARL